MPLPDPIRAFLATPSIRVTILALALWCAYDVGCSYGVRGCSGGSVSRAVAGLYRAYPGLAEYAFIGFGFALILILSWHFRAFNGG